MIEGKNLINFTKKIDNCHTHFTHFPKPKWQTILEQLLNFRKKLLFLLTNNSLGNIKSKYKRHSITSMFTVLNIFIKKRVTATSRDLVSALFNG